jgi:hypothetical protein
MRPVLLLCLCFALPAFAADAPRVTQLKWLSGCWGFDTPDGVYEEFWTTPTGNSMLGVSRRVGEGYTREFDMMRIVTSGGEGFDYVSTPNGGAESRFNSVSIAASKLVFENPDQAFPRRISYEVVAPNALTMRLEGSNEGRQTGLSFPMKRKPCP